MPYQADSSQAFNPPAPGAQTPSAKTTGTPAEAAAGTVAVIPAVDLYLGTVTLLAGAKSVTLLHPDPQVIARALGQAVRPTQWCAASGTLTVTVAAVGKPRGLARHFTFPERPA
ncbi:hypothetical protein IRJ34_05135 [Paenarthrobacter sp. GOM3]|uniref:hypothetical protein n=1 Tax=Paenarthrobacter sp. GOM3 TaxID=2782567 RepID=UPI001BA63C4F|nr:hypothetical protein [Paenarthrobacter sp. GOM3]WOH19708.1 hypothetical protein IRJ34_05135 [Paenarthrobacter sp. GOM3]